MCWEREWGSERLFLTSRPLLCFFPWDSAWVMRRCVAWEKVLVGFGPGLRGYIVFILLPPPGQCAAAKTKYKLWGKYIYIYNQTSSQCKWWVGFKNTRYDSWIKTSFRLCFFISAYWHLSTELCIYIIYMYLIRKKIHHLWQFFLYALHHTAYNLFKK